MFDLSGKVAVVTGGGGIGFGMARGLADAGATVVLAARNRAKLDAAVVELQGRGGSAIALTLDVTDAASIQAMFDELLRRCGRLDVLVNNAGINIRKRPEALSLPTLTPVPSPAAWATGTY
jgi:2-deoxy-D-gluconate 3-dehydrogenase